MSQAGGAPLSAVDQAAAQLAQALLTAQAAFADEREALRREREALDADRKRFEEERAWLRHEVAEAGEVIELNVGGTIFAAHRRTLTQREPRSMLARMLSGRWDESLSRDASGHIFIDGDGEAFRYVLSYLRGERWCAPPEHLPGLGRLIDFLGLEGMRAALDRRRHIRPPEAVPRPDSAPQLVGDGVALAGPGASVAALPGSPSVAVAPSELRWAFDPANVGMELALSEDHRTVQRRSGSKGNAHASALGVQAMPPHTGVYRWKVCQLGTRGWVCFGVACKPFQHSGNGFNNPAGCFGWAPQNGQRYPHPCSSGRSPFQRLHGSEGVWSLHLDTDAGQLTVTAPNGTKDSVIGITSTCFPFVNIYGDATAGGTQIVSATIFAD